MNRSRACGRFNTSMNNRSDAVILDVIPLEDLVMTKRNRTIERWIMVSLSIFVFILALVTLYLAPTTANVDDLAQPSQVRDDENSRPNSQLLFSHLQPSGNLVDLRESPADYFTAYQKREKLNESLKRRSIEQTGTGMELDRIQRKSN